MTSLITEHCSDERVNIKLILFYQNSPWTETRVHRENPQFLVEVSVYLHINVTNAQHKSKQTNGLLDAKDINTHHEYVVSRRQSIL